MVAIIKALKTVIARTELSDYILSTHHNQDECFPYLRSVTESRDDGFLQEAVSCSKIFRE